MMEFERAYLDHFAGVRSFLRVYLGNIAAVDDLAQDTFVQLWARPDAFDPAGSSLRTYLLGIARKKAADWWRRSDRPLVVQEAPKSDGDAFAIKEALALLNRTYETFCG